MSKKNCLVIGGGIAGLNAAAILSSQDYQVTVIEASSKFGGRTFTFFDKTTESFVDNGQHILLGCYRHTLDFVKLIGSESTFDYQKNLSLKFFNRDRQKFSITADRLFYPFNLIKALWGYNLLNNLQKSNILKLIAKVGVISKGSLSDLSVEKWLEKELQDPVTVKYFWEIICVGALNTNISNASALVFRNVLSEIFLHGNKSSRVILPKKNLNESLIKPAVNFINSNEGTLVLSEKAEHIEFNKNRAVSVKTSNKLYTDFDFIISAIPNNAFIRLCPDLKSLNNGEFDYSLIVNVHIWLKNMNFSENFFGLIDSPIHWIFVKEDHINIVISDANYLKQTSKNEIFDVIISELNKFFDISNQDVIKYLIIKEKNATFIPDKKSLKKRAQSKTEINNLFLAGDWTATGLPSTIESAAKSGSTAAFKVINYDEG